MAWLYVFSVWHISESWHIFDIFLGIVAVSSFSLYPNLIWHIWYTFSHNKETSHGLGAGPIQCSAVAVPGPDFGKILPSPIPLYLILNQKILFKASDFTFCYYFLEFSPNVLNGWIFKVGARSNALLVAHGSLEGVGDVITSEECHSKAEISVITETQLF